MKKHNLVEQARLSFDRELHTDTYRRLHSDAAHLEALMNLLAVHPNKRYLDLGTGNGYLAFEMCRRFPDILVTGLDIASHSIRRNRELRQEQGIKNLEFVSYDGLVLPFKECWFAGVISRYAFHHFPNAVLSVQELYRITDPKGFVIISDPMTYDDDTSGFIDQFQQLKADGHVHFFREPELDALFQAQGFARGSQFFSSISFPRDLSESCLRLLDKTPAAILERYGIEIGEKTIHVTVTVMNVLYRKVL